MGSHHFRILSVKPEEQYGLKYVDQRYFQRIRPDPSVGMIPTTLEGTLEKVDSVLDTIKDGLADEGWAVPEGLFRRVSFDVPYPFAKNAKFLLKGRNRQLNESMSKCPL